MATAPATERASTPAAEAASQALSLLIADDHELVRLALRQALQPLVVRTPLAEAHDAASTRQLLATRTAAATPITLALIDYHMPGIDGTPWFGRLVTAHAETRVVVMSGVEDPTLVRELLGVGVAGFIPKTDPAAVFLEAVRLVAAGGVYVPPRLVGAPPATAATGAGGLTGRHLEVLELLGKGLPNKLIARELGLSEGTVKVHVLAIFRALGVRNRTEAVIAASRRGP